MSVSLQIYLLTQVIDLFIHVFCFLSELRQGFLLSCDITHKLVFVLVQQGLCDVACVLRLLHRTLIPKNRSIAPLLSIQGLLVVFLHFVKQIWVAREKAYQIFLNMAKDEWAGIKTVHCFNT